MCLTLKPTARGLLRGQILAGTLPPGTRIRTIAPSAASCGRSTPGQRSAGSGSVGIWSS